MRAAIELPAVAIFTIVAGSLIVLFFVLLSQNQGQQAEADTQARSLQFLDTLLKSAATAKNTETNVTIIDSNLLFSCDATGLWFGYENGQQLPIYNTIIFSPRVLSGGQLKAYTLASGIPYRALNILYLKTDQNIVYNSTDISGFPFETAPLTGTIDSRYTTVISQRNLDNTYGGVKQPGMVILDKTAGQPYGEVSYYGAGTVVYPNQELMYGALLIRDDQSYNCLFNAYLDQIKFVNKVLWERAKTLRDDAILSGSSCSSKYQLDAFGVIDSLPKAEDFKLADAAGFQQAIATIEFVNEDLLKGDHCATIY